MKIVSIEQVPGPADRVRVCLEDGAKWELAREIVFRENLRQGESLQRERLEAILREDLVWRAREAALRLLSHRPRTEAELRLRLLRKDFPLEIADACVAQLRAKGLLDDAAFAEMFVRDRVRLNPRGRRLVVQELRGRGVEAETAMAAVEGVMREEEVDELALTRDAASRWRPRRGEELPRARRRLTGFLARRGFAAQAVRQVVAELLPDD